MRVKWDTSAVAIAGTAVCVEMGPCLQLTTVDVPKRAVLMFAVTVVTVRSPVTYANEKSGALVLCMEFEN